MTTIEIIEERDDDVTGTLTSGVRAFNATVMGPSDARMLSVIARNADGDVVGGVGGRTIYRHFLIEVVWVAESFRGQGLGLRLMKQAEARARERGCTGAQVDTLSFQAPVFYERLGFKVIGTVENFPEGHQRYFMSKDYAQEES